MELGRNEAKIVLVEDKEVVEVTLTQGQPCLIDPEDWERVRDYRFYAAKRGTAFYVETNIRDESRLSGWKRVMLHKLITGTGPEQIVDHRNRNSVDCRRSNLRKVTPLQSSWNTGAEAATQFKGVFLDKTHGRFKAMFQHKGKRCSLGYYDSAEEAAKAYDSKCRELRGEWAMINFPL